MNQRHSHVKMYLAIIVSFSMMMRISAMQNTVNQRLESSPSLQVRSSGLANCVHILDQISGALPDFFIIAEYKKVWIEKLYHQSVHLLNDYKELRVKYQKIPLLENVFPACPSFFEDPILDVFFTSSEMSEAFERLSTFLLSQEIELLKRVFTSYYDQIERISGWNTATMNRHVERLNELLNNPAVGIHLARIARFYNAPLKVFKPVLLLACPQSGFSGASYGNHLLLKIPCFPSEDETLLKMLVSVIVHEATHFISAHSSEEQKENLAHSFLEIVETIREEHPLLALEEPLVMATQLIFVKRVYPEVYNKACAWFNHPLASVFAELIENYINNELSIDESFIMKCAREYICFHSGN